MNLHRRTDDAYEPVRGASRRRQRMTPAFQKAMDASPAWVREAIRDSCSAFRAEAAAYRVEARTHRLRLEEVLREHHTQDHDTSEVLP